MKSFLSILLFVLASLQSNGEVLYSKAFGNKSDMALIFLHGGPGYNCANFEITTAQKLADLGYYVIVYDRRGEGRSTDQNAKYTFQESFDDLHSLYKTYGIKKAGLIGHSFGGIVATLFAEKYPAEVGSLILVGAPVSLQETFRTIIKSTKKIYKAKNDSVNLSYISMLETMDTSSLEYSTYSFAHAMNNKFYSPKEPTEEAKEIYALFKTDSVLKKYASRMTYQGPQGFWLNEKYTTINLTDNLNKLKAGKMKIFALYGKDDGLYSPAQINEIENLIGKGNLRYYDHCSHSVFNDQQTEFLKAIRSWVKK